MYEQLTIKGFFADPPENTEEPAHQADPPPTPEDRPLDKVKEPTPRKRSRERGDR